MKQPVEKYYTFEDYPEWNGKERIELIDGELYMMATPRRIHQRVLGELFAQIHDFLSDKTCEVYMAPFSVRLFEKEDDSKDNVDTVVEPDISVICDTEKLDGYGCKGALDLIIEILSPSDFRYDKIVKLNHYQQAKVTVLPGCEIGLSTVLPEIK